MTTAFFREIPPLQEPGAALDRWQRQAIRSKGDTSAEAIFQAIGSALTVWEEVEGQFAGLFGLLLQSNRLAAQRVYGTLINTKSKMQALSAAAEVVFAELQVTEAERQRFSLLLKHYDKAAQRRNDIAHSTVAQFRSATAKATDGVAVTESETDHGFFLTSPTYSNKGRRPGDFAVRAADPLTEFGYPYMWSSTDIGYWVHRFRDLTEWVMLYAANLGVTYFGHKVSEPGAVA